MENFAFFWRSQLSQWNKRDFVVDGLTYNCAEQYMMAEKARFFGDTETEKRIMEAKEPWEQKALGRRVKNYDDNKWDGVARDVVFKGNFARFSQHEDLKRALLETEGTTLVEASPKDPKWGIGLDAKDPRAQNRDTWRGTNWLGQVLTRVREAIANSKDIEYPMVWEN